MNPDQEKRKPLNKLRSQDLRAIALYTLGNSLSAIQEITHVKSQTLRKKIRVVFEAGLWGELSSSLLEERLAFDDDGLNELHAQLERDAKGEPAFRRAGQTRKSRE